MKSLIFFIQKKITPTLVATDIHKLAIVDGKKLRKLTITELKKLFGFPNQFTVGLDQATAYDLFGNSIVIPVVEAISDRLLRVSQKKEKLGIKIIQKNEFIQQEFLFN